MEKTIKIYGLQDPRDELIKYIGKTESDLDYRLKQHLREKVNTKKQHGLNL